MAKFLTRWLPDNAKNWIAVIAAGATTMALKVKLTRNGHRRSRVVELIRPVVPGVEHLNCPFCGGAVDPAGERGPECSSCGATAPSMKIWDRRAPVRTHSFFKGGASFRCC